MVAKIINDSKLSIDDIWLCECSIQANKTIRPMLVVDVEGIMFAPITTTIKIPKNHIKTKYGYALLDHLKGLNEIVAIRKLQ